MNNERELIDEDLLRVTIRLNIILYAVSGFVFTGFGLMLVTLFATPHPDHMLNILTFFLPGYSLSDSGAWMGLLWGGIIGSVCSVWSYKISSKNIKQRVLDFMESGKTIKDLEKTQFPLNGKILGLIIGLLSAVSLFSTTMYLTSINHLAGKHIHLLSNWLPFYDLTFMGAALGSLFLFIEVFIFMIVVSLIYNKIVTSRSGAAL